MLSPIPNKQNNSTIISATRIGDISITKESHATPEREMQSTGTKMMQPAMEKIKEEHEENVEYVDMQLKA